MAKGHLGELQSVTREAVSGLSSSGPRQPLRSPRPPAATLRSEHSARPRRRAFLPPSYDWVSSQSPARLPPPPRFPHPDPTPHAPRALAGWKGKLASAQRPRGKALMGGRVGAARWLAHVTPVRARLTAAAPGDAGALRSPGAPPGNVSISCRLLSAGARAPSGGAEPSRAAGSVPAPPQRLGAGGPRAVAAPLRAPRAAPSRPRPPAPGRARHVLPAVWIPVFVGTPGEGPPSGPRGTPPDSPARGLPATRGGFPEVRARATSPSHAARRGQEPGKATGAGRGPRSPLCLLPAPARGSEAAPREGPGPGRTVAPERPLGGAWTLRARTGAPSREALGGEAALGPGPPRGCPPSPRSPLQFLMTTNALSTCCESGGRTLADSGPAASAQAPVYCPVYESRLLATARHELNSAAALGVYGGPYGGSQGYGNYVTYGSEASAFYSLSGFDSKEGPGSAHAGLAPAAAAYYPYEPALGQYPYDRPTTGCQSPWKVVGLWLQEGMYSVGRTPESGLEGRAAGGAWRDQGSGWRDAGPPASPRSPRRADPGICSQARLPHPDPRAELAGLQQL
ncbi:iroquois-class homeodomain protein IRX-4 isoform X2 [Manis pentadactyla]|uniref:iroquois-class homeodomain protein IRX-4 isoform X2 n=1 Tax=Manis pentadactyla TaxID=143292 RepID=UPI00255CBE9B|nr:iroquois-class homeodomain protein IRX-4 isoform X2 [Manis pentadactyla]